MKKLLSIFLACLMLMAGTGVTLATHYCGGYAIKSRLMLGQHEVDCGMRMGMKCPSSNDQLEIHKPVKKCCDNVYQTVSADDTILAKGAAGEVNIQFLAAFTYSCLGLEPTNIEVKFPQTKDPPPLLDQDIYILNQSFLL